MQGRLVLLKPWGLSDSRAWGWHGYCFMQDSLGTKQSLKSQTLLSFEANFSDKDQGDVCESWGGAWERPWECESYKEGHFLTTCGPCLSRSTQSIQKAEHNLLRQWYTFIGPSFVQTPTSSKYLLRHSCNKKPKSLVFKFINTLKYCKICWWYGPKTS